MVAFLSAKAGMPLPVADYSQLLVEGDEAQEAATYSVLGSDALPRQPDDPSAGLGHRTRTWPINGGATRSHAKPSRTSG